MVVFSIPFTIPFSKRNILIEKTTVGVFIEKELYALSRLLPDTVFAAPLSKQIPSKHFGAYVEV